MLASRNRRIPAGPPTRADAVAISVFDRVNPRRGKCARASDVPGRGNVVSDDAERRRALRAGRAERVVVQAGNIRGEQTGAGGAPVVAGIDGEWT